MIKNNNVKDLLGFNIRVGDYVVWGETSSSYCPYLCYGIVTSIEPKDVQTWVIVTLLKSGNRYDKVNTSRKFIYPRIQNTNLIVVR